MRVTIPFAEECQQNRGRSGYLSSTSRFRGLLLPGLFLVSLNTGFQEAHRLLRASGAGHFELFSALLVVRGEERFQLVEKRLVH